MPITPKNAAVALKLVGLPTSQPIHKQDLDDRLVQAARYAQFLDRMDAMDKTELPERLPSLNPKA